MRELFDVNLEALKKEYAVLAERCKAFYSQHYQKLEEILCEKTKSDMPNLKINVNGKYLFLHSPYDPIKEAKNWISKLDLKGVDTIAVLGIGAGYHLDVLFENFPNKNKIVIEPDMSVFVKLMTVRDIRHLINAKNTLFIVSDDTELVSKIFLNLRENGEIFSVSFEELLSYRTAYGNWWLELKKEFIKYSKVHEINTNTAVVFSKDWLVNFFENMKEYPKSANLDIFESCLKGVPAVIVSAGPSLNKNIHLLKEIKNKALIISAGSAINILESHGIEPHIMVGVDGGKAESILFNNVKSKDIYFAYSSTVHFDGLKNYEGHKIFFKMNTFEYDNWFERQLGENSKERNSGASVSNLAFDISRFLGCNPIILTGQDLSYSNLQTYAEGAVLKAKQDEILRKNIEQKNKNYIEETDINGNLVYTTQSMLSIKVYFEEYVKVFPENIYFNCTEGGLPIKGIINRPLKEIIDEYCTKEFDICGILRKIYLAGISESKDKREKIVKFLQKVYDESEEMKEKAIKRIDILLDILKDVDSVNTEKWEEISQLTQEIEEKELYENLIYELCSYFIQVIKNDRERKSELLDDLHEKKVCLYEGLLMQYTDIKEKIVLVNEIAKKVLDEIQINT